MAGDSKGLGRDVVDSETSKLVLPDFISVYLVVEQRSSMVATPVRAGTRE